MFKRRSKRKKLATAKRPIPRRRPAATGRGPGPDFLRTPEIGTRGIMGNKIWAAGEIRAKSNNLFNDMAAIRYPLATTGAYMRRRVNGGESTSSPLRCP